MLAGGWRFGSAVGDAITLAGYRLEGGNLSGSTSRDAAGPATVVANAGETLNLSFAWRAEGWVARNYTVFVHLVSADDAPLAQHDGIPGDGYATLFWAPGEVVVDYHPLALPADLAPGLYRILVGLYTRADGMRLPVAGAGEEGTTLATAATVASIQIVSEGER